MAPQLKRAQKSRARGTGKRIVERELIHCMTTENLEQILEDTPKGTGFKGEMRRKVIIELDKRAKAQRTLKQSHSKAGMKAKPQTTTEEVNNNG